MGTSDVVVLGGTGFIGRALVNLLLDHGHFVTVVGRQAGGAHSTRPKLRFASGSLADADTIKRLIDGAQIVFHLATGGGPNWSDFERDFYQGTRNVADACLQFGVKRLIYTSSIAALYLGGRELVNEGHGLDPKPAQRGAYAHAKVGAEGILGQMHRENNLPVVIARPGVVMGRGGSLAHSGIGQWPCDNCCIGWGAGNTPLPFVLAKDIADALLAAMETPGIEGMSFNLAGDVFLSAAEFVHIVAERSCRNFRFYPQSLLKMQALEIAKWALKIAAKKPDNTFPSFRDLKSRSLRAPIDCSAAKTVLRWNPNADKNVFIAEAIDSHLTDVLPGDLRLRDPIAV